MKKHIKLTYSKINEIREESDSPLEFLVNLYRYVIPRFEHVESADGYPYVSTKTWNYIFRMAMKYQDEEMRIPLALEFMNRGFSSSEELEDEFVDMTRVSIVYK